MGYQFLTNTSIGVFQYVFIRLATTVITLITEALGVDRDVSRRRRNSLTPFLLLPAHSGSHALSISCVCNNMRFLPSCVSPSMTLQGEFDRFSAYSYVTTILNFSQFWALYMLAGFYLQLRRELEHAGLRPLGKFATVKAIVFFSWWQGVFISMLTSFGVIRDAGGLTTNDISKGLQDFIICVEILAFAWCHHSYFSYLDFRNEIEYGMARKHSAAQAVKDMIPADVIADARIIVKAALGLSDEQQHREILAAQGQPGYVRRDTAAGGGGGGRGGRDHAASSVGTGADIFGQMIHGLGLGMMSGSGSGGGGGTAAGVGRRSTADLNLLDQAYMEIEAEEQLQQQEGGSSRRLIGGIASRGPTASAGNAGETTVDSSNRLQPPKHPLLAGLPKLQLHGAAGAAAVSSSALSGRNRGASTSPSRSHTPRGLPLMAGPPDDITGLGSNNSSSNSNSGSGLTSGPGRGSPVHIIANNNGSSSSSSSGGYSPPHSTRASRHSVGAGGSPDHALGRAGSPPTVAGSSNSGSFRQQGSSFSGAVAVAGRPPLSPVREGGLAIGQAPG